MNHDDILILSLIIIIIASILESAHRTTRAQ